MTSTNPDDAQHDQSGTDLTHQYVSKQPYDEPPPPPYPAGGLQPTAPPPYQPTPPQAYVAGPPQSHVMTPGLVYPQPYMAQPVQPVAVVPVNFNNGCIQFYMKHPFLIRGVKYGDTTCCPTSLMITPCIVGPILLLVGTAAAASSGVPEMMILPMIGGLLLALGIFLLCTASRQFKNLPPDHPDRVNPFNKYFAQNPALYNAVPMQPQGVMYTSPGYGIVPMMQPQPAVPYGYGQTPPAGVQVPQ